MDSRLKGMDSRVLTRALADFIMPRTCIVCGTRLIPSEDHLCACCLSELPVTLFSRVSHNPMADAFNARLEEAGVAPERYCYATALFYYGNTDDYGNITKSLKYGRNFAAGKWFARELGRELAGSGLFADVDLVVPVPLHWTRRWKRGYNQAAVIAGAVAGILGAECDNAFLRRRRRTRSQARLSTEAKMSNVAGAFSVRHPDKMLDIKHILIIDDVFTTGSTLASCHAAIRKHAGPEVRISVATLAYAAI